MNFTYPGSEIQVIDNLSFSMTGPGFYAVFGPSGVGKTSFARLLTRHSDLPDQPVKTPGIDTILYTYNLERLPGWAAVGRHLDQVCPADRQGLKDESLANVDEKLRQTILPAIKERFSHKMFLYISHNLMEVTRFCKEILVLAGPSRNMSSRLISGLNETSGGKVDKSALDRVMLEIMNAF